MINKQEELIEELRILKEEKGFTFQQIADRTRENGEEVSLSTIKLVFSDKRQHNHDYNNILVPIFNAMSPKSEDDDITIKILQTRLEMKNEIIAQLRERLDKKENNYKDREEFLIDQLNFCKDQIQFKDSQIKRLNEAIDRKDKMIRRKLIEDAE